jgi:hypothetical protein
LYDFNFDYSVIYIDFDDTITKGDKVNPDIMRLIYQWRNENKSIHLITRHAGDLKNTLGDLCIPQEIFDSVIHIVDGSAKSNFIDPRGAIFIDNAYLERAEVRNRHQIPVFDVDTTEILHNVRG